MGKIIRNGIKYSGTTNSADKINYNNALSGLEAENAQEAIDELNSKIGTGGGGSSAVYLTQEEYDALPESKLTDGIEYFITDANASTTVARNIAYDNSESGIEAVSVQGAIDKLANNNLDKLETYSTEEVVVGTWIDGKPIYRKSYSESGLSTTSTIIIDAELNSNVVDQVIKYEGSAKCGDSHFFQRDAYSDKAYNVFFRIKDSGLNLDITNYTVTSYAVTVYYTKAE